MRKEKVRSREYETNKCHDENRITKKTRLLQKGKGRESICKYAEIHQCGTGDTTTAIIIVKRRNEKR